MMNYTKLVAIVGIFVSISVARAASIGTMDYPSLADAVNNAASGATITLSETEKISATINVEGKSLTLDGGGNTVTFGSGFNGTMFNIAKDASLSIVNTTFDGTNDWRWVSEAAKMDPYAYELSCNETKSTNTVGSITKLEGALSSPLFAVSGSIIFGEGSYLRQFVFAQNDTPMISLTGGGLTFDGARIEYIFGIQVRASGNATVEFTGGSIITNNYGYGNKGATYWIGGNAVATLTDAYINGNAARARSGVIFGVVEYGKLIMDGGTICNNVSKYWGSNSSGSMICLEGYGRFEMNGGVISGNIGTLAGAISTRWYSDNEQSVVLNSGIIRDNTTSYSSWSNANIFLRSSAVISSNAVVAGPVVVNSSAADIPGALDNQGVIEGDLILNSGFATATSSGEITGSVTVSAGELAISGGVYGTDVSPWVEFGLESVKTDSGEWLVVETDDCFIWNLNHLNKFANNLANGETFTNKHVHLCASIDLAGAKWVPLGGWDGDTVFAGEFNGNGKSISNFVIDDAGVSTKECRFGFFSFLGAGSRVRDLVLESVDIVSTNVKVRCGGLAGTSAASLENVIVRDVDIKVAASTVYAGGVVGLNANADYDGFIGVEAYDVVISNSYSNCSGSYLGGLVGHFNTTKTQRIAVIEECVVSNVTLYADGACTIGGVWGNASRSGAFKHIVDCNVYNINLNQLSTTATASLAGGFCGFNGISNATIENCHVSNGKINVYSGNAAGFIARSYAWGQDIYRNCSVYMVDINSPDGVAAGFVAASGAGNQPAIFMDCEVYGGYIQGKIASGFAGIDSVGNAGGAYLINGCMNTESYVFGKEFSGGLIARASSTSKTVVIDSFVNGSVNGEQYVCEGIISAHPTKDYIESGDTAVLYINIFDENEDMLYEVATYEAAINSVTCFARLEDALAAWKPGDLLDLLIDTNELGFLEIPAGAIFDGNGHILTGTLAFSIGEGGGIVDEVDFSKTTAGTASAYVSIASTNNTYAAVKECDFTAASVTPISITSTSGATISIVENSFSGDEAEGFKYICADYSEGDDTLLTMAINFNRFVNDSKITPIYIRNVCVDSLLDFTCNYFADKGTLLGDIVLCDGKRYPELAMPMMDSTFENDISYAVIAVSEASPVCLYGNTLDEAMAQIALAGSFDGWSLILCDDVTVDRSLNLTFSFDVRMNGNDIAMASGETLSITNANINLIGGTLSGFTPENLLIGGTAVLGISDEKLADSFDSIEGYEVTEQEDGSFTIKYSTSFKIYIALVNGKPRIGFPKSLGSISTCKVYASKSLTDPSWDELEISEANDVDDLYLWVKFADEASTSDYRFFKAASISANN